MVFGNAHYVGTLPNEFAFGQVKKKLGFADDKCFAKGAKFLLHLFRDLSIYFDLSY